MPKLARELRARIKAKGLNGEPLPLLTDAETLEEIRKKIFHLIHECPNQTNHRSCPFRALAGLSYASAGRLVTSLSREACLNLFEMELNCRVQDDSSDHSAKP